MNPSSDSSIPFSIIPNSETSHDESESESHSILNSHLGNDEEDEEVSPFNVHEHEQQQQPQPHNPTENIQIQGIYDVNSNTNANTNDNANMIGNNNDGDGNRRAGWNPLGLNLNPLHINFNPLGLNLNPLNLNLNMTNLNPLNLNLNPLNLHVSSLNPLNLNLNPLNLNLNPLNVDFQRQRERAQQRMHDVVEKLRSDEYRRKMNDVLVKIKNTKEYQATSMTDYDVVFETVDMFTNMESDITFEKEMREGSPLKKVQYFFKKERIATLLFVPMLGILIALMGVSCDIALGFIDKARTDISTLTKWYWINWVAYVAYSVMLAFASVSCISFISPYAVGSGIPEIKSILNGIDLSRVLGKKTLVSKIVGMVCAIGSGMCLGRTGPFMHASAIIANQMMYLPFFKNIRRNQIARYQMIIAGLSAGVVANFGAPIGGLLFSIEITATNCVFGSLWKGLLCSTTCAVVFFLTRGLKIGHLVLTGGSTFGAVYKISFVPTSYTILDLCSFCAMGVLCGLVGALFVFCFEKVVRFRLKYAWLRQRRIAMVVTVATLSAVLTYFSGPFVRLPLSTAMKELIAAPQPSYNLFENRFANLSLFIVVKLFLTLFNVVLPIPGGAITPFIVIGAALGRMFGEAFNMDFTTGVIPAGFAVVGAAGLVSGTIRALAPAIFVLELTGQLSLLIPVLICSISAAATGNFFNKPLFDTVLSIQNLPFLSQFRSEKVYRMYARDVMRADIHYLAMTSTIKECKEFLVKHKHKFTPIVKDLQSLLLYCIAETNTLQMTITEYEEHCMKQVEIIRSGATTPISPPSPHLIISHDNLSPRTLTIVPNIESHNSLLSPHFDDQSSPRIPTENIATSSSPTQFFSPTSLTSSPTPLLNDLSPQFSNNNNNNINADVDDANNNNVQTQRSPSPSEAQLEDSKPSGVSIEDSSLWDDHLLGDVISAISEGTLNDVSPPLMDVAPTQVPAYTPLNKVFHLFTMLGLGFAFVTDSGSLVGVISKKDLIEKNL